MKNNQTNNTKRDDTAAIVASIYGVTADYVRKVRRGDRTNDEILSAYMDFKDGKRCLTEAIKQLVPKKQ